MHLWRYHSLLILFSPLILLWLLAESWQHKSWTLFTARLGKTNRLDVDKWFHCASIGEVNVIAPLIQRLAPQKNILITCFTPTGLAHAQQRFAHLPNVHCRLLPFDWRSSVKRFLAQVNCPSIFLVETELWPNLICQAAQQHRQVYLINARLTHKTLQQPIWRKQLLASLVSAHVQQVQCRHQQDKTDWLALGIADEQLFIAGNLKWCDDSPQQHQQLLDRRYVLLASSHQPEEIEIARRWQATTDLPTLVIVPRHPKRGKHIAQQLQQVNLDFAQLSRSPSQQAGILLADCFGQLPHWIAYADWVIMGGSFVAKGGQNPLEAIRLGKPVLAGTDMSDFSDELQQLAPFQVIQQLDSYDSLIAHCRQMQQQALHMHAAQAHIQQQQQQILRYYLDWLNELP